MNNNLTFVHEDGVEKYTDVTVYALSTCGFCKRALKFLREHNIKFRYIYVDDLEPDEKQSLKESLAKEYNSRVGFPFLVIDNSRCLVGFTQHEWEKEFSID
ncbi:MAG TPA: glutaredoxin [Spirochaetota bacterium]|nr:glutaredoxin [Spirochaetota bacterium]HPJ39784.1 glutaredoxin [Spirochaetota bacterium]HPQ52426.1 glutaredoxin [Spirochaetota bacterium]